MPKGLSNERFTPGMLPSSLFENPRTQRTDVLSGDGAVVVGDLAATIARVRGCVCQ